MAVRFKRVFGLYTFFSVFLPGSMFLIGIAPFLDIVYADLTGTGLVREIASHRLVTLLGVLVFVTLGMFVGFVLHSLGALFEKKVGEFRLPGLEALLGSDLDWLTIKVGNRHRELFYEMLNGRYEAAHPDLVSAAIETVNEQFPRLGLDPEAPQRGSDGDETGGRMKTKNEDVTQESGPEAEVETETDTEADTETEAEAETDAKTENGEFIDRERLRFRELASSVLGFARGAESPEDRISEAEAKAMYSIVRSRVHMDKTGRSRTFQAVVASCRSMLVAWVFLTLLYTFLVVGMVLVQLGVTANTLPIPELLQQLVSWLWPIETEPPSLENLTRAFAVTVIAWFVGTYGLAGVVRNYKRHYLEYLVSDYLLLYQNVDEDDERQEGTSDELPDRRTREPRKSNLRVR